MKTSRTILLAAALASGVYASATQTSPREHVLDGAGLGPIYVDQYEGPGNRTVLLFHQGGGSARGEYAFLVEDLLAAGFDVWAADIHGGGDRFGEPNRAVAARPDPEDFGYCDPAGEVEAVLDFVRERSDGPVVLWGSSYTAALVVRVAAARAEDVAAVLAFSPASGERLEGCRPEAVAGELTVPALVVRPEPEMEYDWIAEQLQTFAAAGAETLVTSTGSHGSSVLNPDRGGEGSAAARQRVFEFLRSVAPGSR